MSSQKLSIYTIKTNEQAPWLEIVRQLLTRSTEQERCIINEQTDSYIGGCYLLETINNQTQYNIDENRFESIPVKRLNIMKFDIFIENNTLLLWGGKKVATSFLTALELASNQHITIKYKDSDYKQIIKYLLSNPNVVFTKMKITGIIIDQGLIANCIVSLREQEEPNIIITKYLDNISQIGFVIGKNELATTLTVYSSGAVVIYKDRDDIADGAMNIISEMFGGIM